MDHIIIIQRIPKVIMKILYLERNLRIANFYAKLRSGG
ncbi:hypothetical protein ZPR_0247 [Zunongwangia profunda SM-A87]|uniref:Uncharacterized protein n=1 Tax=Zunongwangia profunda (strain DSM 18752 / CCTCC AB 206139 / SM-A87) TaxID=655815 RepID=D5BCU6_ZUNPS|nr:hypothetical protein ZPR_0247 [Zunongwangia profunda SM-A87]